MKRSTEGDEALVVETRRLLTELREAESRVRELAYFDNVTGLPNRALLQIFLKRALHRATAAAESGRKVHVLSLDLDAFKRVNDTLGHAAGDALLREVAKRLFESIFVSSAAPGGLDLDAHLEADAMVARLGGDEFVIVLEDRPAEDGPAALAERIGASLRARFVIGGSNVFISASIGIACSPHDGELAEVLLERADAALYDAKDRGRSNHQFFSQGRADRTRRRVAIENNLRAAVARLHDDNQREIHLVYQPQVEGSPTHGYRMASAEALMRFASMELGFVSPAEFIPIAEDCGVIVALGEWALLKACTDAKRIVDARRRRGRGSDDFRVSVNVSAHQFGVRDFAMSVRRALASSGLPAECLELELTESSVMKDPVKSGEVLEELKSLGVHIALDDFGTGYSSLSQLARLPIDVLKIDRSFVSAIDAKPAPKAGTSRTSSSSTSNNKTALITSAIIGLARGLAIDIVVEGVETEAQLAFLSREAPAAKIQGYYFAKPMPFADLARWSPPGSSTSVENDNDDDFDGDMPRADPLDQSGVFALPPNAAAIRAAAAAAKAKAKGASNAGFKPKIASNAGFTPRR